MPERRHASGEQAEAQQPGEPEIAEAAPQAGKPPATLGDRCGNERRCRGCACDGSGRSDRRARVRQLPQASRRLRAVKPASGRHHRSRLHADAPSDRAALRASAISADAPEDQAAPAAATAASDDEAGADGDRFGRSRRNAGGRAPAVAEAPEAPARRRASPSRRRKWRTTRSTWPARRRRAALVRVYANDEFVGEAQAGDAGAWLVEARSGRAGRRGGLRADALRREAPAAPAAARRRRRSCATPTASCWSRSSTR